MDLGSRVLDRSGGLRTQLPGLRAAGELPRGGVLRHAALPAVPARERLQQRPALRSGALRVGALAALLLALPLAAAPARAQHDPIGDAEAAFAEGRHEDAEGLYRQALQSGRLAPPGLARVYLRLAELAALGSTGDAARLLGFALALDPALDVPASLGPVEPPTRGVRVVLEVSDDDAPIGLRVADAPDTLVRVLEVRGRGFERTLSWDGEPREVDPPADARPIEVRALDTHGNLVAQAGRLAPEEPAPAPTPDPDLTPEPEEPAEEGTPAIESPWFWVGVGLVVVGVAVAVAFSASGTRYVLDAPVIR